MAVNAKQEVREKALKDLQKTLKLPRPKESVGSNGNGTSARSKNKRDANFFTPPVPSMKKENKDATAQPDQMNVMEYLSKLWARLGVEVFIDQFEMAWAFVKHFHRNVLLRSKHFRSYIFRSLCEEYGGIPNRRYISDLIELSEASALEQGPQRELCLRSAPVDGKILLDKGTADGNVYEISRDGVRNIEPKVFPFRREPHMKPLPQPDLNANPADVRSLSTFMPLLDGPSQLLLIVWVVTVLIPNIPRPCLILHGCQGSGKSFLSEVLRDFFDPSAVQKLGLPRNERELVQALSQHFCPAYDNLQLLRTWQSDTLCRAVTGLAYTKRRLFTDSDSVLYSFCHTFILTGITPAASQPDLLDRSLLVELPPIDPQNRRSEEELRQELDSLKPRIFGGMLNALSQAMSIKDDLDLPLLPRMADWARWAAAVAQVIGFGKEDFLTAFNANLQDRHWDITDTHPVAKVLRGLMERQAHWGPGSATELYKQLMLMAEELNVEKEQDWPHAPNAMSRALRTLAPSLRVAGIDVTFARRSESDRSRTITIRVLSDTA